MQTSPMKYEFREPLPRSGIERGDILFVRPDGIGVLALTGRTLPPNVVETMVRLAVLRRYGEDPDDDDTWGSRRSVPRPKPRRRR